MTGMKVCPKCGRDLEASKFWKNSSTKDGLQCWCIDCMNTGFNARKTPTSRKKPETRKNKPAKGNVMDRLGKWLDAQSLDKLNVMYSFTKDCGSLRKITEKFVEEGMDNKLFIDIIFSRCTVPDLQALVRNSVFEKTPRPDPVPETKIIKIELPRKPANNVEKEQDPDRAMIELVNAVHRLERIAQDQYSLFLNLSKKGEGSRGG